MEENKNRALDTYLNPPSNAQVAGTIDWKPTYSKTILLTDFNTSNYNGVKEIEES